MFRRYGRDSKYSGSGLLSTLSGAVGTVINKAIDILPTEIHVPGYQYCGPGTDLKKRLARGDRGINKLDAACKEHDISYATFKDNKSRAKADQLLAERAWERVKASDSGLGEKTAAWTVTNIMKAKNALGGGKKQRRKKSQAKRKTVKHNKNKRNSGNKKRGKGLYLKPYKGSGCNNKKKISIRK